MRAFFASLFGKAKEEAPLPWYAKTEDTGVYIFDANNQPIARVFGELRDARIKAEFIIECVTRGGISR